ncbi:hypothetical protein GOBAR_DD14382 [Gossypium barbadense]|nr:hypothetical protein GOBAR_DD14382 [Gossypium barbadense]
MKDFGLGFKKFDCLNNAFLMKLGFNLINKSDQLWVQILRTKYKWKRDKWFKDWGPLIDICTHPEYIPDEHILVKDMVMPSGVCNWLVLNSILPPPVILSISAYKPPSIHNVDDFLGWIHYKKGYFSVKSAYAATFGVERARSDKIWHQIWHILGPQKLWVKRNKYVFNADFIETGSVLERSLWMRDSYPLSNHGMEYPLRHTTVRSCRLRKWTSPEDGWAPNSMMGSTEMDSIDAIQVIQANGGE